MGTDGATAMVPLAEFVKREGVDGAFGDRDSSNGREKVKGKAVVQEAARTDARRQVEDSLERDFEDLHQLLRLAVGSETMMGFLVNSPPKLTRGAKEFGETQDPCPVGDSPTPAPTQAGGAPKGCRPLSALAPRAPANQLERRR